MGIKHLRLATPDFNNAPNLEILQEGVDFIKDFKDSDASVYVHCKAGRGRSATLVACYLMKVCVSHEKSLLHVVLTLALVVSREGQVIVQCRSLNLKTQSLQQIKLCDN